MRSHRGFTLLETLISVAIFSILMIVIFKAFDVMQKATVKSEGKNDANSKFVRLYSEVNRNVGNTNIKFFKCYKYAPCQYSSENKWFAFPVTGSRAELTNTAIAVSPADEGSIGYSGVIMYFLYYKPGCCESYDNCPHKTLYKAFLPLCKKNGNLFEHRSCNTCSVPYSFDLTQQAMNMEFDNNGTLISKYFDINVMNNDKIHNRIVEKNLVSLDLICPAYEAGGEQFLYITFTVSFFRTEEAEKEHFRPGRNSLITPSDAVKKYIEKLSWTSVPGNT